MVKNKYLRKDEKTGIVGIPINPNRHAKQSLRSEFWQDFLTIFIGADDIFGFFLSIISAVLFIITWTLFLVGKYVFRLDLKKPKPRKRKT